jgi:hypothetical protein
MVCAKFDVEAAKTERERLLAIIRIRPKATGILSFFRGEDEESVRIDDEKESNIPFHYIIFFLLEQSL